METVKRIGLKVAAASAGIVLISGCGSVAPMANNTKELGTTSEVSSSFSANRTFFDLKTMQTEKRLREKEVVEPEVLPPIDPVKSRERVVVEGLPEVGNPRLSTYTVKKGDTLSHIARRFQVGVGELAHCNDMDKNDTLMVGTRLTLPTTAQDRGTAAVSTSSTNTYTVKKGDTLSHIAKREGVTVTELKEWNGLTSDSIRAGQALALGPGGIDRVGFKPRKRPVPKDGVHVVQSGENLSTIAYMYGMKTKELKALNNLSTDKILPDQKLKLRSNMDSVPAGPAEDGADMSAFTGTTAYVVKSGDILGRIAPKFGVTVAQIMKANDMTDANIKVGQKLAIPVKELSADTPTAEATVAEPVEEVAVSIQDTTPAKVASNKDKILIPHFVDKESDTLQGIANMYGSTVTDIKAVNPTVKSDADLAKVTEVSVPVPGLNMP